MVSAHPFIEAAGKCDGVNHQSDGVNQGVNNVLSLKLGIKYRGEPKGIGC